MRVRIKDIAAKANVSTGTVDRVIHNRGKVSPEVKARIEKVMSELGYKRNIIASTLAYNRTLRLAVLISEQDDAYWRQIRLGVEKAQEATMHYGIRIEIFCFDQGTPASFEEQATRLLTSDPDGVLFVPLFLEEGKEFLEVCRSRSIPTVIINTQLEAEGQLCYIGQDSYHSGYLAARLVALGVADCGTALLLNLDASATNAQHLLDKERGFRDYFLEVQDKDVKVVATTVDKYQDRAVVTAFLEDVLAKHDDLSAIFVTNSRAFIVADCLPSAVLNRIMLVGFDLIEPNIAHLRANNIDFLINQNPILQGYLGVINLTNHLVLRQEVAPVQYLPLDIVVAENYDYYLKSSVSLPVVV